MDRDAEIVRVVVVSPGDVPAERKAVVSVVDELNRRLAPAQGYRLSVWRWETDARPGLHLEGPQGLIDERMEISDADVVIGIFWKRFGTPTADAASGTEHELRRAWAAWREHKRPDVMVYFCGRKAAPAGSAEAEQWLRVSKFREELPKEQLWWPYKQTVEFERLVRGHLEDVLLRRAAAREPPTAATRTGGTSVSGLWFRVQGARRRNEPELDERVAFEDDIDRVWELGERAVGPDHVGPDILRQGLLINPGLIRVVVQQKRRREVVCGYTILAPLTAKADELLRDRAIREANEMRLEFLSRDPSDARCLYIGMVLGEDRASKGYVKSMLRSQVRHLLASHENIDHIYGRPVSDAGRRLLSQYDFQPLREPNGIWHTDRASLLVRIKD